MSLYINARLMRQKMSENHMTYAELANKSEVSVSTVKRILGGAPTSYQTAVLLAATLDMTVDELAVAVDEPSADPPAPLDDPPKDRGEQAATIKTIERIYAARINELRDKNEDSQRELRSSRAIILSLIAYICVLLFVDFINPSRG